MTIHHLAIVEEGAVIGENVTIEPYAIVKGTVTLKDGVTIKSHAYIDGNTTIGENTVIFPFASIGTRAQDLKYQGEETFVVIGKNCTIREYVTINSSCGEGDAVLVGDNCYILAYCHIAHNCKVGNNVIMSNAATLAGHVVVEDNVVVGGFTPLHQFTRIGKFAMVGGMSRIPNDVPPFVIAAGIPAKVAGLNMVGLKRQGVSLEIRQKLTKAFRLLFRSELSFAEAMQVIQTEHVECKEVMHLINFCKESQRGVLGINKNGFEDLTDEEKAELATKNL